jgi:hypothetical protein
MDRRIVYDLPLQAVGATTKLSSDMGVAYSDCHTFLFNPAILAMSTFSSTKRFPELTAS